MSFRAKIFLYGGIILVFLIGLILAIVLRSKTVVETSVDTNVEVLVANQPANSVINLVPPPAPVKPITQAEVKEASKITSVQTRVKNFVERFGSYSVEANFQNFEEIKPWATAEVATWLNDYPAQLKKQQVADFIGVTTRVLSQKIITSTETIASVQVSTQREETKTSGQSVTYKDMLVKLVLTNGEWLVDGAYWQ